MSNQQIVKYESKKVTSSKSEGQIVKYRSKKNRDKDIKDDTDDEVFGLEIAIPPPRQEYDNYFKFPDTTSPDYDYRDYFEDKTPYFPVSVPCLGVDVKSRIENELKKKELELEAEKKRFERKLRKQRERYYYEAFQKTNNLKLLEVANEKERLNLYKSDLELRRQYLKLQNKYCKEEPVKPPPLDISHISNYQETTKSKPKQKEKKEIQDDYMVLKPEENEYYIRDFNIQDEANEEIVRIFTPLPAVVHEKPGFGNVNTEFITSEEVHNDDNELVVYLDPQTLTPHTKRMYIGERSLVEEDNIPRKKKKPDEKEEGPKVHEEVTKVSRGHNMYQLYHNENQKYKKLAKHELSVVENEMKTMIYIRTLSESTYTGLYLCKLWETSTIKVYTNPSFLISDIPYMNIYPFTVNHVEMLNSIFTKVLETSLTDNMFFEKLDPFQRAQYFVFGTIYSNVESTLWKEIAEVHMKRFSLKFPQQFTDSITYPLSNAMTLWEREEEDRFQQNWKGYVFKYYSPNK